MSKTCISIYNQFSNIVNMINTFNGKQQLTTNQGREEQNEAISLELLRTVEV